MSIPELPKISVVTLPFNQAKCLAATMRGVLDQRYPNLECIVIDSRSGDGSVEIVQTYSKELAYCHDC